MGLVDAGEVGEVWVGCLENQDEEGDGNHPSSCQFLANSVNVLGPSYSANKLAATLASWIMHCNPTSIAGECSLALADTRHIGRLAAVKVITKADATIQAVTTSRRKCFDSDCRHAGDVKKLLPGSFVDCQAVALHRPMASRLAEP